MPGSQTSKRLGKGIEGEAKPASEGALLSI
jgi:hypothetical protein